MSCLGLLWAKFLISAHFIAPVITYKKVVLAYQVSLVLCFSWGTLKLSMLHKLCVTMKILFSRGEREKGGYLG